jgi:hypothetical protein
VRERRERRQRRENVFSSLLSGLTTFVLLLEERIDHVLRDGDTTLSMRSEEVSEAVTVKAGGN